jgi:hypothetical protein
VFRAAVQRRSSGANRHPPRPDYPTQRERQSSEYRDANRAEQRKQPSQHEQRSQERNRQQVGDGRDQRYLAEGQRQDGERGNLRRHGHCQRFRDASADAVAQFAQAEHEQPL